MSNFTTCPVCDGYGEYGIINAAGAYMYDITCPECDGEGEVAVEASGEDQEQYEYPPSTAAKILTLEELREFLQGNAHD